MTTRKPTTKPTPKPAADQAAEAQARLAETPGAELLKPFASVRGSDQLRLFDQLAKLGLMTDSDGDGTPDAAESVSIDSLDLLAVADLVDYVSEHFANDPAEFDAFTSGPRGFERAMRLAVAYAGELGNVGA